MAGKSDETFAASKTGIRGLDEVLDGGGLTSNRTYLIEGMPGAGKTTLALQFLLEGNRVGERGLYITLSETKRELEGVIRSHGWDGTSLDIREFVVTEEGLAPDANLTMFHPSEVELTQTIERIIAAIEQAKPARVVIDALSEIRLLSQDPFRYRRQILALKQYFMSRDMTVLLLDDMTADGPDNQVRSVAHGIIVLEQLAPAYGAERRRLQVTKLRGRSYRAGYHDYRIRRGGIEVFPRLVASEHHEDFTRSAISSGVRPLDNLIGGGPVHGTTTLFMGPAGSGKTTVASQYLRAAADRGEKVAAFIFDEVLGVFLARSDAVGLNLRPYIDSGVLRIQQIDAAEVSPGEFSAIVRKVVEEEGFRVLLIDSLNGYINSMPEERFLTTHLHELFSYLNQRGVATIVVVAQRGLVGTMNSHIDASYLADSIVIFRFFESQGRVRRAISIMKRRVGPHEDTIRELQISDAGVTVGEPLSRFRGVLTGIPVLSTRRRKRSREA